MIHLNAIGHGARILMGAVAIVCFVHSGHADDGFVKDLSSGCAVFKPNLKQGETVVWQGACLNGYGNGRGIAKWTAADGTSVTFEGSFIQGKLQSAGKMTASGGDRYEGTYRDGMREGRGAYVSANGDRYEGEYKNNQRNGRGVLSSASGQRVEGEWRNGSQVATTLAMAPAIPQASLQAQESTPSGARPEAPAVPQTPADRTALQRPAAKPDAAVGVDGQWYSDEYGIGIEIRDGRGIATATNQMGHKPGDVILELQKPAANVYAGRMLVDVRRPQLDWVEGKAALYPDRLRIGLQNGYQIDFKRGVAPKLSDAYPSGVRYIAICRGGTFIVAAYDKKQIDFRRLPTVAEFKLGEAPGPLAQILPEVRSFVRAACGDGYDRAQYPVFFESRPLPALPLSVRSFDAADARAMLQGDRGTLYNKVAVDATAERQAAVQKSAEDAAIVRAKAREAKREEFFRKLGAKELETVGILGSNPFALEGKIVGVSVIFRRMLSPTDGDFEILVHSMSDQGGYALVTDIPRGTFLQPVRALLAAKVVGTKPGKDGDVDRVQLKYVGALVCPEDGCP